MKGEYIKDLVSIGLPVFNRPEALHNILEIITKQTYLNLEIIISDNASTKPEVEAIVKNYQEKDSRIKYFKQNTNLGVLKNAEFVLTKSSGEFFAWVSDDDWRALEFIEYLVAELKRKPDCEFAFSDYIEVAEDGSYAEGYPLSHLKTFKPFQEKNRLKRIVHYYFQDASQGKGNLFYGLYRKKALDQIDLKDVSGDYTFLNMDCLIVYKMLQRGACTIIHEGMCALTCGNKKYHPYYENKKEPSLIKKIVQLFFDLKNDRDLYIKFTDKIIEKIIVYFLFYLKFMNQLLRYTRKKVFQNEKSLDLNFRAPERLKLKNITLTAMATRNVEATLKALQYSMRDVEFGEVKLISHYRPYYKGNDIKFFKIDKIKSIDEWSEKAIYHLPKYIDTDFMLLVHADGFVVNASSWRNDFLEYDYIGAPWPLPKDNFSYRDINGNIVRQGNSVSIRSKKLLDLPIKLNLAWEPFHGYYNEDGFVCVKNRHIYEEHGMKFAPLEVAKYFSHENMIPEIKGIKPFVFHKWFGTNKNYPKFT